MRSREGGIREVFVKTNTENVGYHAFGVENEGSEEPKEKVSRIRGEDNNRIRTKFG